MYREIPIIDAPSQRFTTTLTGARCDFLVTYSTWADRWSFDLDVDGVRVISGRRIVLGRDLFEPKWGVGRLVAAPWTDGAEPGRTELPSGRVRLFHYDPAEV